MQGNVAFDEQERHPPQSEELRSELTNGMSDGSKTLERHALWRIKTTGGERAGRTERRAAGRAPPPVSAWAFFLASA